MAFRSVKKDIDRIYQKVDKIAKGGRDNFQEYYNYIDTLISNGQYGLFTQVLYIKYNFDYTKYSSVDVIKTKSWPSVMSLTNTNFQDNKYTLMKSNDLYQIGLTYYKEIPTTYAKVVDASGTGAYITPIVENGGVTRIDVIKSGKDYSTASTIQIVGGYTPATAEIPTINGIRGGMILKVNVIDTGSFHNQDIELGEISEVDTYDEPILNKLTPDELQKLSKNKSTYLIVDKVGVTQSATFSSWDTSYTYDKNLLNLYKEAFSYLL